MGRAEIRSVHNANCKMKLALPQAAKAPRIYRCMVCESMDLIDRPRSKRGLKANWSLLNSRLL